MRFKSLYEGVQVYGEHANTRAGTAKQLLDQRLHADVGKFPCRVGGNAAVGLVEGLQLIAGTADPAPMKIYAPNAKHELFGLNSYYGPRIASQVPRVIAELKHEPRSRRAVLFVGSGADNPDTLPCTTSFQFQQMYPGSSTLATTVTMRSGDMVWGLPYDIIQFSMLAFAVARCSGMHPGPVVVNIGNCHIYDETAVKTESWEEGSFRMPEVGNTWEQWLQWSRRLVRIETLTRSAFFNIFDLKLPTKGEAPDEEMRKACATCKP